MQSIHSLNLEQEKETFPLFSRLQFKLLVKRFRKWCDDNVFWDRNWDKFARYKLIRVFRALRRHKIWPLLLCDFGVFSTLLLFHGECHPLSWNQSLVHFRAAEFENFIKTTNFSGHPWSNVSSPWLPTEHLNEWERGREGKSKIKSLTFDH